MTSPVAIALLSPNAEEACARLSREERGGQVTRVLLALFAVASLSTLLGLGIAFDATRVHAACTQKRDAEGYSWRNAVRAFDEPERHARRWSYRVASALEGYRATVTVRDGEFSGDTWERDETGRIVHLVDVCAGRSDQLVASLF